MSVGIIIACRYDSSRLPGKILMTIRSKQVLEYIVERVRLVGNATVVVATSEEKSENPIAAFCEEKNISCYRGPKTDVARRMLDCAKFYRFDYFIRVCGDNIFADPEVIRKMIFTALDSGCDFVSNVKGRSFPRGMSVEILRTDFFAEVYGKFRDQEDKEHVTKYLYDNEKIGNFRYVYNEECPDAKNIKLALDDENDLSFISRIVREMTKPQDEYLLKDLYKIAKKIKGEDTCHP